MTSLPTDRPLTVADMLRLADVCERDGYVSNLGTNIRRAFTPAPAPSPVEGDRVDYGSIGEQAKAWEAVCDTAQEVFPGWHHLTNRGIDSMCVLLRNNASSLAAARAEVERARARAQSVAEEIQEATLILNRAVVDAEGLASSPTVEKGAGK